MTVKEFSNKTGNLFLNLKSRSQSVDVVADGVAGVEGTADEVDDGQRRVVGVKAVLQPEQNWETFQTFILSLTY